MAQLSPSENVELSVLPPSMFPVGAHRRLGNIPNARVALLFGLPSLNRKMRKREPSMTENEEGHPPQRSDNRTTKRNIRPPVAEGNRPPYLVFSV